ncbi:30S ribosomal protein S9 [Candidatus Gracilibacteria bacterium HOT-871]|nr:30S ribosomal protein S9 [Candidatus Gracilibacteria bacterium HOT-871]MBB1564574.1 30S ribosomal protein S9 [Candidatus Gracilibacteria bacterium]RKW23035.1 MAG: 30S ribosomal protein S9 [Candidatus Gracilibacteria bacterium]
MANKYIYNVGKRKTASAQVKLFEGKGKNTINGKDASEYITRADLFEVVFAPLKICKVKDNYYFEVAVTGSGISAQAEAIRHGLSRNLASSDEGFKRLLKAAGFLTRDSRKVERKKPGKKKARKSPSWSKR